MQDKGFKENQQESRLINKLRPRMGSHNELKRNNFH
ncbi:hypothetical protein ES705_30392 [subsurface metagenome]